MSGYKFVPNEFAKKVFNLHASKYEGEGMTDLLMDVLGEENYRRYIVAQDPIRNGELSGDIDIIINSKEFRKVIAEKGIENIKLDEQPKFKTIGTMYKM